MRLRSCGVPKFSFSLRVTPPSTGAAVGSEFDQALASSFSDLTRVPLTKLNEHRGTGAPSTAWAQAQLPVRHGGFVLRCQHDLAPLAYLGYLAQCLAPLRQAFPSLRPRIDALLTPAEPTLPSLEEAREALLTLQREGVAATVGHDVPYTWENV